MTDSGRPLRVVLVGTGTSVGKTWVGRELLRELGRREVRAVGLKPIESGLTGSTPSDGAELSRLSAAPVADAPYGFGEPLSPHFAARRAGAEIELQRLLTYVQSHESSERAPPPRVVVVETAGGLFSPLSATLTNWDFARALEPARWVLVAPDALGVLHDVTATLLAARSRGRVPDEIILSAARPADSSSGTNADELRTLGVAPRPFACAHHETGAISALVDRLLEPRAPDSSGSPRPERAAR